MRLRKLDFFRASSGALTFREDVLWHARQLPGDRIEITVAAYRQLARKHAAAPLPSSKTDRHRHLKLRGAGDLIHLVAHPVARAIDTLTSGRTDLAHCRTCAARRAALNNSIPF